MNETDQKSYIQYLEKRLEKISENLSIGDYDLDNLIDTQNEILLNNSFNFKKTVQDNERLTQQVEMLQNKVESSNQFIQYLMHSFWWKTTYPFRLITRNIKNRTQYQPFDFSQTKTIKDSVKIFIYANDEENLSTQIGNIKKQTGIDEIQIVILDIVGSKKIAKIATLNHTDYINLLVCSADSLPIIKTVTNSKYIVYINQNFITETKTWLHKILLPLSQNYATLSALYHKNNPQIESIKKNTFFNELKTRFFNIEQYEGFLLPTNRNNIQFIPPGITDEAIVIAKRN